MKNHTQLFRREQKRNLKIIIVALLFLIPQHKSFAQASGYLVDGYGRTLNISAGAEYYTFIGKQVPFLFIDHEFDVARNFTLAPSIGIGYYQSQADNSYENI